MCQIYVLIKLYVLASKRFISVLTFFHLFLSFTYSFCNDFSFVLTSVSMFKASGFDSLLIANKRAQELGHRKRWGGGEVWTTHFSEQDLKFVKTQVEIKGGGGGVWAHHTEQK